MTEPLSVDGRLAFLEQFARDVRRFTAGHRRGGLDQLWKDAALALEYVEALRKPRQLQMGLDKDGQEEQ